MSERTYPYKAWVLQPSFKPKEVELVKPYVAWSDHYGDETASKKVYRLNEIFPSKEKAIEEGWRRIKRQEADLDKRQESLNKKKTALTKASFA